MNSDLVVISFLDERDASKAESALRIMREGQMVWLQYAVSVSKDRAGKTEMRLRMPLPANLLDRKLLLLCTFVNEFFYRDAEAASGLVKAGLDKNFVDQLRGALVPGSSALLIYSEDESLSDIARLETVLSLFEGKLYRATFSEKIGDAVLALGMSDDQTNEPKNQNERVAPAK